MFWFYEMDDTAVHQIGTAFAAGTEIQNLRIPIVIGNRPHSLILLCVI
jgi:hypothetical protein